MARETKRQIDLNVDYNPVFQKLLDAAKDQELVALVAYSLYKQSKIEWIVEFRQTKGRKPTSEELHGYSMTWTERKLEGELELATQRLFRFANEVVNEQAPQIREEAISERTSALGSKIDRLEAVLIQRTKFPAGRTVLWSLVSSLMSGFLLILMGFFVAFFFRDGLQSVIDLLGRARDVVPKG